MIHPLKTQQLAEEILALLNKRLGKDELITHIVLRIKDALGIESVGLRLNDGDDYPYFVTRGFSADFVRKENFLCERDPSGKLLRDSDGNPMLECMCGNVLQGRTDSAYPFFTSFGSFWSNGTTELLSTTTEADRQARTRNRCNGEGYESVALIPIRTSSITHGLLQLNDRRRDAFTLPVIEFVEGLGSSIGLLFSLRKMEEELARQKADISRLVSVRTKELSSVAETLLAAIRQPKASDAPGDGQIEKLRVIVDEMKMLKGILPICCMCKRIRDDEGHWGDIEAYIENRTGAEFSHGVCPVCYETYLQNME